MTFSRQCLFRSSHFVDKKTRTALSVSFCLVGVARLELAALRSRTVRATKLRYTPKRIKRLLSILTAFAIYINLRIFATKTSQLS